MARTGTITLYEGIGKTSNKPFKALKLEVGTWTKLYFLDSRFEMDYIEQFLTSPETPEEVNQKAKNNGNGTPL